IKVQKVDNIDFDKFGVKIDLDEIKAQKAELSKEVEKLYPILTDENFYWHTNYGGFGKEGGDWVDYCFHQDKIIAVSDKPKANSLRGKGKWYVNGENRTLNVFWNSGESYSVKIYRIEDDFSRIMLDSIFINTMFDTTKMKKYIDKYGIYRGNVSLERKKLTDNRFESFK
ncbi:MAG: hypothetical protein AAF573_23250, partial [Bacteroidota bacterium]